jgi:hypothetical protein
MAGWSVAELQITAAVLGMLAVKAAVIVGLVYFGVRFARPAKKDPS